MTLRILFVTQLCLAAATLGGCKTRASSAAASPPPASTTRSSTDNGPSFGLQSEWELYRIAEEIAEKAPAVPSARAYDAEAVRIVPAKTWAPDEAVKVINFGNGVYFFATTKAEFAYALSRFIGRNPDLEFVSMVGDGNGFHGRDVGYYTVFRSRAR